MTFTLTQELETLIQSTHARDQKRVFSLFWQGQKLWIKWTVPPKAKIYHRFQYVFRWIHPLIRPTVCMGGTAALSQEMQRLKYLKQKQVCVPTILGFTQTYMILSDLGPSFTELLKDAVDPVTLLNKAALGIADLHKSGEYCSTGLLRDMTVFRTNVGFLDLEENLEAVMDISAAQTRNVLLFWLSSVRYCSVVQLKNLIDLSLLQEPAVVIHHLEKIKPFIRFLKNCSAFLSAIGGRDLREAAVLACTLDQCLNAK